MADRIHGPYKHRRQWRVIEVRADGSRALVSFATEAEALKYIAAARRVAIGQTVGSAVTEYLDSLRATPGRGGLVRRESTVRLAGWRLVALLRLPAEDRPLGTLTRSVARSLFERRSAEVKPDTLQGELATVDRWVRYCIDRGYLGNNPFDGLVVMGERSAGKPQLRIDEARRFLDTALAEESREGLAAALALLTGMRATEITGLLVHDLDDGGRVLWVADNAVRRLKTRKQRQLAVPSLLVPYLQALAAGKAQDARLWGDVDRHWLHYHVSRLCEKAGVPLVTPHGLRGTWATLARGVLPTDGVAATLGNLPKVSERNYIAPGAAESADSRAVEGILGQSGKGSDDGETEVDAGNRGGRDLGGGRVRHDGRAGAPDADGAPAVRLRPGAGSPRADGAGPGAGREDAGVRLGGGPAAADSVDPQVRLAERETRLVEKFPGGPVPLDELLN